MTDSIDHRNRCRFLWEEVTPLVERPAAGDPEAPVLVGAAVNRKKGWLPVASSGAEPSSSRITRSTPSTVSMKRPSELSARPGTTSQPDRPH
jgi:hypothetical protein